jgi:hypothetical protein
VVLSCVVQYLQLPFFAMASVLGECWIEAFGDVIQGAVSVLDSC